MKRNITFFLFTKNEERRISYAIQNLLPFGEVILLDGGSSDKTQEIALSLGVKFFARPDQKSPFVETEQNFNFAKSLSATNWIYWGYVDNFVPKKLLEKVSEIASEDVYLQVTTPLHTFLWGDTSSVAHKGYATFFFNKNYMDFKNNRIHSIGKFLGSPQQTLKLENTPEYTILHFSTYTISKFILGNLRYSEEEALQKKQHNEKFSILKTLAAIIRYTFLFWRSGANSGKIGLLIMLNYGYTRLITYTRLYELEHNITIENVEENYSIKKESLLKNFK